MNWFVILVSILAVAALIAVISGVRRQGKARSQRMMLGAALMLATTTLLLLRPMLAAS